jgi:hypothetical protein
MRYFKRDGDVPRGDANNAWGRSWWYFETDSTGAVTRQVEIYDHGPTLRYSFAHPRDEFGGLSDAPLDLKEFASFEVVGEAFDQAWRS